MSSEKVPKKRPGYKSYESSLRNAKQWMKENPEKQREITKRYYDSHKEIVKQKSKASYHLNKFWKELLAIEL